MRSPEPLMRALRSPEHHLFVAILSGGKAPAKAEGVVSHGMAGASGAAGVPPSALMGSVSFGSSTAAHAMDEEQGQPTDTVDAMTQLQLTRCRAHEHSAARE